MNDLAEKALHGLDAARRYVRDRPMISFGIVGLAASAVVVIAGGQVGAARSTRPLTTWLGLQDPRRFASGDTVAGAVLLVALVALVLLWIGAVEVIRRTGQPENRVWWLAGVWSMPFVIGPPMLDTSVYTYVAFGRLQRSGHSPYASGPSRLGTSEIVAAIDPGARGTPSSAGPLGSLVQHLALSISGGALLGAVLVLRAFGVVTAVYLGRLAAELSGSQRSAALSLSVLNPLVLLYVVSSPHLEGMTMALVLAALVATRQQRWVGAVVVAAVAGSVTAQGFVAVPIIIAAHVVHEHRLGRRGAVVWKILVRDVGAVAVTVAAAGFIQPHGFDWVLKIRQQFSQHTPFAVAEAISKILSPIVRGASYDDLAAGGRITAAAAAAFVVGYLIVSARYRSVDLGVGYALLGLALLAPVLDPWYLVWGLLALVPAAQGPRRLAVLALSAAACLLVPPGFSDTAADLVTAGALLVIATIVAAVLLGTARRDAAEVAAVSAEG
jgi:hypothetical protein